MSAGDVRVRSRPRFLAMVYVCACGCASAALSPFHRFLAIIDQALDVCHDLLCFLIAAVNHQPTRTLRNPTAKENDDEPERRADSKRAAPPEPDWNIARIKKHKCCRCAKGRADPV